MKIAIFGTGYVGLVSGVCFAEMGNSVICVDVDQGKVQRLQQGQSPIYEAGLDMMLSNNIASQRIEFTCDASLAIERADIIFIAVGTPPGEDGSADLSYVLQVAKTIARYMNDDKVIVNKSTVPVGTVDRVREVMRQELARQGKDVGFDVVSNPEFLKEGVAIKDCMSPDRIIVGLNSKRAERVMRELYAPFNRNRDKLMVMDPRSAEMTKYVANAMLATKISFMNEMSQMSALLGVDIEQVRQGIGADSRIGYDFIYPGCGFGGSCFPKDIRALKHMAQTVGYEARMVSAVNEVNYHQKALLFNWVFDYFNGALSGKVVALWGLAFKPNTDDIREAPARLFMEQVWEAGGSVRAYDPQAMSSVREAYGDRVDCVLCESPQLALQGADVLVIATEWLCFRSPDFDQIKSLLRYPVVFDGRNLFDPERLNRYGLQYFSVGRSAPQVKARLMSQLEGMLEE